MPKTVRRLSNITTLRGQNPGTSSGLSKFFMNFRINHTQQMNVRPNRLGCADEGFTTMNASGRSLASVGGAHDTGEIVHQHRGGIADEV